MASVVRFVTRFAPSLTANWAPAKAALPDLVVSLVTRIAPSRSVFVNVHVVVPPGFTGMFAGVPLSHTAPVRSKPREEGSSSETLYGPPVVVVGTRFANVCDPPFCSVKLEPLLNPMGSNVNVDPVGSGLGTVTFFTTIVPRCVFVNVQVTVVFTETVIVAVRVDVSPDPPVVQLMSVRSKPGVGSASVMW